MTDLWGQSESWMEAVPGDEAQEVVRAVTPGKGSWLHSVSSGQYVSKVPLSRRERQEHCRQEVACGVKMIRRRRRRMEAEGRMPHTYLWGLLHPERPSPFLKTLYILPSEASTSSTCVSPLPLFPQHVAYVVFQELAVECVYMCVSALRERAQSDSPVVLA